MLLKVFLQGGPQKYWNIFKIHNFLFFFFFLT